MLRLLFTIDKSNNMIRNPLELIRTNFPACATLTEQKTVPIITYINVQTALFCDFYTCTCSSVIPESQSTISVQTGSDGIGVC